METLPSGYRLNRSIRNGAGEARMGLHRVVRSGEGGMTTPEAAWLMPALHPDPVQQQDSARAALCPTQSWSLCTTAGMPLNPSLFNKTLFDCSKNTYPPSVLLQNMLCPLNWGAQQVLVHHCRNATQSFLILIKNDLFAPKISVLHQNIS